jgi:hypothetical protein
VARIGDTVALGDQHEISVDAGPGNDTIVLVDYTAFGDNGGHPPAVGFDALDCGAGNDRALVSPSVTSVANCENVTVAAAPI